ncbi:zinc ribbon domain-containing protein [Methanobrevibacter millerae]|uniref:Zinc-ribbon domain-containing protein n=1 Tax=Methanobrevibacter millerae TaxID=230361 RepID=A0A1G5UTX9_9EURY|nr:zinc-ribbon domain-containing protein [Methanobrevibacter millerae]SDA37070.1 zinc-ribbon domain-containing protein [Methanobrevibacter millerae]
MAKYCKKCGAEIKDNALFCPQCGAKGDLAVKKSEDKKDKNKYLIIGLIAVVAILAAGVLYASGVFNSETPLQETNFGDFKMLAPVGSNYVETNSVPSYGDIGGFIILENGGKYKKEVYCIMVSTIEGKTTPSSVSLDRQEGDITIFKDNQGNDGYLVERKVGDYEFTLMGSDDKAMIKMLNSVQITNTNGLLSKSTPTVEQTSSTAAPTSSAPASSSPSSISILGGSFTTGSADADKTYARINVGTAHAGENVIVQIFYSRDGNALNNGNMVPASVHSDGYLEIASADAYKYYPDHATIKIYDSNSKLLTTKDVSLSPTSGTQTF